MSTQPDPRFEALIRNLAGPLPLEPRLVNGTEAPAPEVTPAESTVETSQAQTAPTEPAEELGATPEPTPSEQAEDPGATSGSEVAPEITSAPEPAQPTPSGPTPAAVPRPGPRPRPPAATSPAPVPSTPATEAPLDPAQVEAAAAFGRVNGDGTVYVTEAAGERVVGQFPDAAATDAMLFYIRRFLDLEAQVSLSEARLPQLTGRDIDATVAGLTASLEEPAAVGDLDGLRARLATLTEQATERKRALAAERAAVRDAALAERTAVVERAEELAAADPGRIQWRTQGDEMRRLLDQWKDAQRNGPRLDRRDEEALWKRFAKARGTFDRHRRSHFAELDAQHKQVKAAKEELIARAEALQDSTDWGATSAAYRGLMEEWKHAGRAARKDDDALWARFRAAQDVFFAARSAQNAEVDATYAANLEVKNAILAEAEALVPVTDVRAAKATLRKLQDRWEAAGKVPRDALQRIESRMRAVEKAIRDADDAQWRRSNPRVRDRAEGFAAQLQASIERLEDDLAKARATGDERKIRKATEALDAQRAFLAQARRAADEAR